MISLTNMKTFGGVAAEDEHVLDYFLTTDAVAQIKSGKILVALGRKGSGKTALVYYFASAASDTISRSLNLKGYPWNVHATRMDNGAAPIEAYVASWRYLICLEIALQAYQSSGGSPTKAAKHLEGFMKKNYGGMNPQIGDVLRPNKISIQGTKIEPQILGIKLGSVDFSTQDSSTFGLRIDALSDALLECACEIAKESHISNIFLHFDELDQGIDNFDETRKRMLVGLILAARNVFNRATGYSFKVCPIVYMRTDLWNDLKFSDKNKITQERLWAIEWDSNSLLGIVNERLNVRLGEGITWKKISTTFAPEEAKQKWLYILARTLLRPRDVIMFLNFSLEQAKLRNEEPVLIRSRDIENAREKYSAYLKAELDDEIIAHWPEWEEALQACSAIGTLIFTREEFIEKYDRRRTKNNFKNADEALQLMFQFSVIAYDRGSDQRSSWVFEYTNPESGWDNRSSRFMVHLGLQQYAKLESADLFIWDH